MKRYNICTPHFNRQNGLILFRGRENDSSAPTFRSPGHLVVVRIALHRRDCYGQGTRGDIINVALRRLDATANRCGVLLARYDHGRLRRAHRGCIRQTRCRCPGRPPPVAVWGAATCSGSCSRRPSSHTTRALVHTGRCLRPAGLATILAAHAAVVLRVHFHLAPRAHSWPGRAVRVAGSQ